MLFGCCIICENICFMLSVCTRQLIGRELLKSLSFKKEIYLPETLSALFFRHRNRGKLSDLVAEHLDHLHYLNDILIINCEFLNDVLTDHLLNRLFLPLYVYSLVNQDKVSEYVRIYKL